MATHKKETKTASNRKKANFSDIARLAGVSESTVNRVLNEIGSVSESSRRRVVNAAKQLDVRRILPDVEHQLIHIDVLISHVSTPIVKRYLEELNRILHLLDKRVRIHRISLPDAEEKVIEALIHSRHRRDAIIVVARDTPLIRNHLNSMIDQGTVVITLMSQFPELTTSLYSGIDNYQAGKTAGWFIQRLSQRPGRVLKLLCNKHFGTHSERSDGFSQQMLASGSFEEVEIITDNSSQACYDIVVDEIKKGELVGIYNSGDGSDGIFKALKEFDRVSSVTWVGHEMYDYHISCLKDGAMDLIIDQDPDTQIITAIRHALNACGLGDVSPDTGPVEFRLFCPTNHHSRPYLRS
ncbi:LacI family DNA-binding transcriptional regulator [Pantoea coffeiphila]|uniref:LacI family DNA-binding transcriptional regulator n=1 Tax=Pantoea coffeiphila TaxID=1465635 RepID=UPI00196034E5|nr:LacI family DNA-binding transcriptional regulator [Pantoea coffeiphila]MBM7341431.1 LacI family transcriptional regulator [Pantoea coffeiphila]